MAWFREVRAQVSDRMAQKLEALKTTPVGMVREKRWAATATVLVKNVDAPLRWHCQDGRRVGCTGDGLESRHQQVCRAVGLRPVTGSNGVGACLIKFGNPVQTAELQVGQALHARLRAVPRAYPRLCPGPCLCTK